MYSAQLVEVKGDINLESVQVYPASGSMNFSTSVGGDMGYCPPPPQPAFGGDMDFCPPPPQPAFGGGFNAGYGFPSAPPSFMVCISTNLI
jgi:hypothetical protein